MKDLRGSSTEETLENISIRLYTPSRILRQIRHCILDRV